LGAIDAEAVRAFHAARFNRASALVAFAGDVDEATAETMAERLTQGLPDGQVEAYPAAEPAAPKGRRLVLVDKPGRTQTQMALGTLGTLPADDDHIPLLVANCAFGGTFTSRLVQEIRSKRGWSYSTASHLTTSRVREAFSIWAAPSAEDAAPCLTLALELFERWHDGGIDTDELRFCQDFMRRSWAFEIDTAKKRLQQRIERRLLGLAEDYHDRFVERVEAVTLDQANAAVRRRLSAGDLWVAVVASEQAIGPSLREAVDDLVDHVVEPHDLE
jgi:zinc protease